ncbi:MAG: hypothetical protein R3A79_21210 [Nannocystaceae bacterium]
MHRLPLALSMVSLGLSVPLAAGCSGASSGDTDTAAMTGETGETGEATSDGTAATDSGVTTDAESSAYEELAEAYCEKLFGCCTNDELAAELAFYDPTPTDVPSCVELFAGLLSYEASSIAGAAEAGRLAYDEGALQGCAQAIRDAGCDQWWEGGDPFRDLVDDPACAAIVTPKVADGGACGHDRECVSDRCDLVADVCQAAAAGLGGPCTTSYDCEHPYRCDSDPNDPSCVEPLAPGEACTRSSECGYGVCDSALPGDSGLCVVVCDGV